MMDRSLRRCICLVGLAAVAALHPAPSSGQDTPQTRWTLLGLREAGVYVEPIDTVYGEYVSWPVEEIEFQARVKIREMGLWLLEPQLAGADAPPAFEGAFLRFSAIPTLMPAGTDYSVILRVEVVQPARLERDVLQLCARRPYRYCDEARRAGELSPVTTWSTEVIRVLDLTRFVQLTQAASLLIDRFITAWREANEI